MKSAAGMLFFLMGLVGSAHGAGILYNIEFKGQPNSAQANTTLATGSFRYDAAVTNGNPFSDFVVLWQGIEFNMTNSVNTPNSSECPAPSGTSLQNHVFNALFGETFPCGGQRGWSASNTTTPAPFFLIFDLGGQNDTYIGITGNGVTTSTNVIQQEGRYVVRIANEVPEPSTAITLIGATAMFLATRRAAWRRE